MPDFYGEFAEAICLGSFLFLSLQDKKLRKDAQLAEGELWL
jgi:hypothetical protein